jgi:hypothetical protein
MFAHGAGSFPQGEEGEEGKKHHQTAGEHFTHAQVPKLGKATLSMQESLNGGLQNMEGRYKDRKHERLVKGRIK